LRDFREEHNAPFNNMFDTFEFYAFDGGMSNLGETVFMSTSLLVFSNHACDGKPNFEDLATALPYTMAFYEMWNPVATRIRTEIDTVAIAARDIKRGEMITNDYTSFDGFMVDHEDKIKVWCADKF
jgi:hypothetical protein